MNTTLGQFNPLAIAFFLLFVISSLGITYWAAKQTKSTEQFYTAGGNISGFQNGLALAGDFMSAASFLGIAGLVALNGFDGLIYSIGFLVGNFSLESVKKIGVSDSENNLSIKK